MHYPPKQRYNKWSFRGGKPSLAKNILFSLLAKYNLQDKFLQYKFVNHWEDIVGEDVAKVSLPLACKKHRLIIAVKDNTWAQELSYLKKHILYKLKPYFTHKNEIRDIQFVIGDF